MRNVEQGASGANNAEARAWIEERLRPKSWRGDEAVIHCPLKGHPDAHASASANSVKRTWYCHGCAASGTLTDLARELGVPPPPWQGANGTSGSIPARAAPPPDATYRYCDERGETVFEVVRLHGEKGFRQRHTADDGKIVWKVPPAGRGLPYRLPELAGARPAGDP